MNRQIAIGAQRVDVDVGSGACLKTTRRVGYRNEALRSEVTRALTGTGLAQRGQPWTSLHGVVSAFVVGSRTMRRRVKRLDRKAAAACAWNSTHLLDAVHLEVLRPVAIGKHVVVDIPPVHLHAST